MPATPRITLREITFETIRAFLDLDVADGQHGYVASNARSIAEASFNPGAWLRGICAEDTPAGLILLSNPAVVGAKSRGPVAPGDVFLWRFMIAHQHQGQGVATRRSMRRELRSARGPV